MEIKLFDFLQNASPWWWVALALGLGVIEMMTFTYFMLWLSMAATTVALALWIAPDMSGTSQVVAFAASAILYAVLGYLYLKARKDPTLTSGLNQRSTAMVGRKVVVSEGFNAGVGWVEVDGIRWRARLAHGTAEPQAGDVLDVSGAEGMTLEVSARS